MGGFVDKSGQHFGRLKVIKRVGTKCGSPLWECKCECGNTINVNSRSLSSGNTKSCGCIHSEQLKKRNKENGTHHCADDRLYNVWHAMKQRCYYKRRKDYPNYGGRGIKMCDEWKQDFSAFRKWALESGYQYNAKFMQCTIDRIDVDENYCPDNCRWVDMKFQANNRRKRRNK